MTENMGLVQKAIKDDSQIQLVSFSVTPKIDSVAQLKRYAIEKGILDSKWNLLTGDKKMARVTPQNLDFFGAFTDVSYINAWKLSGASFVVDNVSSITQMSESPWNFCTTCKTSAPNVELQYYFQGPILVFNNFRFLK